MKTFLKILIPAFVISLLITGCTEKSIEEFVFKNTLSYKLNGMCGENEECKSAVDTQMQACLNRTNWQDLIKDDENEEKLRKFANEFFPCFKSSKGDPYFKSNFQ